MINERKCKACRQVIPVNKDRIKKCIICEEEFEPRKNKFEKAKYCSQECKMRGMGKLSQEALKKEWDAIGFEKHAKQVLSPFIEKTDNCWNWTGKGRSSRLPYGRIDFRGEKWMAHRLSFGAYKGEIPEGMLVLHTCDNPACVNPEHLYLGTYLDNQNDKRERGRCKGEKLTEEQVKEIKKRLAEGESLRSIGKAFGVSGTNVKNIKNGIIWSWVGVGA